MAEEVKKVPKPVDPNSAKYKLGKIAADAYVDAIEAKKRGEKVAWVSSNFPVEIPETMGIATVYPENQAAGIAARGAGTRMCEVAESEGYSNDICAYARVSLAYAKLKSCPEQDVAMPDVLLCCSNICSCMIKWYENLARELNIPMVFHHHVYDPVAAGAGDRRHSAGVFDRGVDLPPVDESGVPPCEAENRRH